MGSEEVERDGGGHEIVQHAARLTRSVENQEETADRRTQLAADRTLLAAERTYAAWVRTGLASLASGIGARALLDGLVHPWLVLTTSVVLLLFSQFCFVAAVWRQLRGAQPPPVADTARLPAWALVLFNGFLLVLSIAVLVGILTRRAM